MSDLLDLLSSLDILNKIDRLVGNVRYGPHHRFWISRLSGWTGWEIECLLARHGVRIWGRGIDNEYISFNVKRCQANWAEYLLKRRGIPVVSQPVNPKNDIYAERYAPGSEPPGWRQHPARKGNWLDAILFFFIRK